MSDDKVIQQKYMELQTLNQQIQQLHQQSQALEQQHSELLKLSQNLDELDKVKPQSKMYAPLGGGLYVEGIITETKKVLTNVGADVVVPQSIEATKQIIEEQIDDLQNVIAQVENKVQEFMKKGQGMHKEMMALSEKQEKNGK
ncbi:MAG TPA: prefoldin subunit alpha [Candidatus Nanoarchaeia archaeon]|nr:prefoldin subunit alpha [Candidatus Nanoarchaeia archaeon]